MKRLRLPSTTVLGVLPALTALATLLCAGLFILTVAPTAVVSPSATPGIAPRVSFANLPLSFEPNQGQTADGVDFLSRGRGYTLFLKPNEAVLSLPVGERGEDRKAKTENRTDNPSGRVPRTGPPGQTTLRMEVVGANPEAFATGEDELPGKSNYFIGNDPEKWRTNIPTYRRVKYEDVYPGIDLAYYGTQGGQLEYDFIVVPGADPNTIRLQFNGADDITLDGDGNLHLATTGGEVIQHAPVIYQEIDGERQSVDGGYTLLADNRVAFNIPDYDSTKPLLIDPIVFLFSTYLGGSSGEHPWKIVADATGNAYVAGHTSSVDFPTTVGAFQETGGNAAFVAKVNTDTFQLVYATYLKGNEWSEAFGLAVDAAGNAYVGGATMSAVFPVANAFQATCPASSLPNGKCGFLTKLNPSGSVLVYSTYLSGSEATNRVDDVAVDGAGNAVVTGWTSSEDFPILNPLQGSLAGSQDAFIVKFSPEGTPFFSTFFGGSSAEWGHAVALDGFGNIHFSGSTNSTDLPMVDAPQPVHGGIQDAFVAKISPDGSSLIQSTFIGGSSGDSAFGGLTVTPSGDVFVAGQTISTDFPVVNALQPSPADDGATYDSFFVKLSGNPWTRAASTYFGEAGSNFSDSISVDPDGNVHVAVSGGGLVAMKLDADLSSVLSSVQVGNGESIERIFVAAGPDGTTYITGRSRNSSFPLVNEIQGLGGLWDVFVSRLILPPTNLTIAPSSLDFGSIDVGTTSASQLVTLRNEGAENFTSLTYVLEGDYVIAFSTCLPTLAVNGECTLSIEFSPLNTGTRTGTIKIRDSALGSLNVVRLLGFGGTAPIPSVTTLSPNNAAAGGASFTLTVNGSNFVSGSVVRWNGVDRVTTFTSDTQLSASIPASDIAADGTATITVFNPSPGRGTSNGVTFTITTVVENPVPSITAISPGSTTVDGDAFTIVVTGLGFVAESVAQWNGADRNTTFKSSTELWVDIFSTDILTAGTATITVLNPSPGGGTSNGVTFTITAVAENPVPSITAISPGSATAGDAGFTLTIEGTNFITDSVVRWNGADRTTTFISATQLTATIPDTDMATEGTAAITVFNPAPGGGTSNGITFDINLPDSRELIPSTFLIEFPRQMVGATALPISVTLTNVGTLPVNIESIITEGDVTDVYAHVNTCGSRIEPDTSCDIAVFFQPSRPGLHRGTLTITTDANGSPHVVELKGEGMDYGIGTPRGQQMVTAGQTASYTVDLTPLSGFNLPIGLTCTSAISLATCEIAPSSVTPNGVNVASVTVSVTTAAPSRGLLVPRNLPAPPIPFALLMLAASLMLGTVAVRSRWRVRYSLALILLGMLALSGCGKAPLTGGTPIGTHTLLITGTATQGGTNLSHNLNLTLTVE